MAGGREREPLGLRVAALGAGTAILVSLVLWWLLPPTGEPSSLSIVLAGIIVGLGLVAGVLWKRVRDAEARLRRIEESVYRRQAQNGEEGRWAGT